MLPLPHRPANRSLEAWQVLAPAVQHAPTPTKRGAGGVAQAQPLGGLEGGDRPPHPTPPHVAV